MSNTNPITGPDVRIRIVQHYKEWRPGDTVTVDPWVAQQLVEGHKAIKIKDIDPISGVVKRGVGRPRKHPIVIDGILH